jgi:L-iditol 2-dehydrogenase
MTYKYIHQYGVDKVFEASGKADGIVQTTQIAKAGADILMIGIPMDDKINVSHAEARKKGLTFKMVRCYNHMMKIAIDELLEDRSYLELISHRVKPDALNQLINDYHQPHHTLIKSVLVF